LQFGSRRRVRPKWRWKEVVERNIKEVEMKSDEGVGVRRGASIIMDAGTAIREEGEQGKIMVDDESSKYCKFDE